VGNFTSSQTLPEACQAWYGQAKDNISNGPCKERWRHSHFYANFEKSSAVHPQRLYDGNPSGSIGSKPVRPFLAEKEEITSQCLHCISGFKKDAIQTSFSMFLQQPRFTIRRCRLLVFSDYENSWYCIRLTVSKPVHSCGITANT